MTRTTSPETEFIGQDPGTGIETGGKPVSQAKRRLLGALGLHHQANYRSVSEHEQFLDRRTKQEAIGKVQFQLRALEYLSLGNIYSYSKSIPRRSENMMGREGGFEGSYDELAAETLERTLDDGNTEDGSFELLSLETMQKRVAELVAGTPEQVGMKPVDAFAQVGADRRYSSGVPTLLWKLGVMHFDTEKSFVYGKGESFVAHRTVTREGHTELTTLTIPFDSDNTLHQRIAEVAGEAPDELHFEARRSSGTFHESLRLKPVINEAHEQAA